MIKAVVFDLGKVLVDFDYLVAARRVAARSRVTPEEFMAFLSQPVAMVDYETGRLNRDQFFVRVRAGTGFAGTLEEFAHLFGDIFTEIEPMTRLQADLRRRGYPTYVFSNTNDMAVEHIRRAFPFFANFDGYVYSYEHGVMKPAPGLYEVLERQSGRRGPALLYLDDRAENLDTAASRGWQTILHETPEKSLAAVRGFGLVP